MSHVKVRDLMTTDVVTIGESDTLDVAEQIMAAARIHHLPVVGPNGELVGLLTKADLLRAHVSVFAEVSSAEESALMRSIPVEEVMTTAVCTVGPDDLAEHAARTMKRAKYGCLPVVGGGRLLGILTEGDFVELAARALEAQTSDVSPMRVDVGVEPPPHGPRKPVARA